MASLLRPVLQIVGQEGDSLAGTREMQRRLWRNQFPPLCSHATPTWQQSQVAAAHSPPLQLPTRYLVTGWPDKDYYGLGTQLNVLSAALYAALASRRVLVFSPTSFRRAHHQGCRGAGRIAAGGPSTPPAGPMPGQQLPHVRAALAPCQGSSCRMSGRLASWTNAPHHPRPFAPLCHHKCLGLLTCLVADFGEYGDLACYFQAISSRECREAAWAGRGPHASAESFSFHRAELLPGAIESIRKSNASVQVLDWFHIDYDIQFPPSV